MISRILSTRDISLESLLLLNGLSCLSRLDLHLSCSSKSLKDLLLLNSLSHLGSEVLNRLAHHLLHPHLIDQSNMLRIHLQLLNLLRLLIRDLTHRRVLSCRLLLSSICLRFACTILLLLLLNLGIYSLQLFKGALRHSILVDKELILVLVKNHLRILQVRVDVRKHNGCVCCKQMLELIVVTSQNQRSDTMR